MQLRKQIYGIFCEYILIALIDSLLL